MTKNFKGGYKIVSLNGNDLTSVDAFTIEGLYASLENSYKKPILVTEIVIDGEKEQDAYAVVKKNESGYSIEVYGYALTVTDEDSVTSVALPEITSIGTGLDLTDGELSASGGGSTLYQHDIRLYYKTDSVFIDVSFTIFSDSATELDTTSSLKSYYDSIKVSSTLSKTNLSGSGYFKTTNANVLVTTVRFETSTVNVEGVDPTTYGVGTGQYGLTNITVTDSVFKTTAGA